MVRRLVSRGLVVLVGAFVVVSTMSACVESLTTQYSWGGVCPTDQVCDETRGMCVYPAQIAQCEGRQNTYPCEFPGADPDTYMCQDELCLPKAICGNGSVEPGESCDGTALGADVDETCVDQSGGFTGGVLLCDSECAFDTRRCTTCGDSQCEPDETLDSCLADCGVQNISVGDAHTCVTLNDGTARCWGTGEDAQLGNLSGDDQTTPQPVYGITTATWISAGGLVTCTLLQDGHVRCCGDNSDGALGDGLTEHYDCGGYDCGPAPVTVAGVDTATQVAVGLWHACVLLADTTVRCWGDNSGFQLGNSTGENRFTPTEVSDLTGVVRIAVGASHSCAVLANGSVRCWGYNDEGSLGDGTTESRRTPVAVHNVTEAVQVGAGGVHTCALIGDGQVRCWGHNYFGQLGDATYDNSFFATWVAGIYDAAQLTVGARHACVLLTDGTVRCWGSNGDGQLGDSTHNASPLPVEVEGLLDVVAISAGGAHTCALTADGALWCWGSNSWGQLGNGTWTATTVPVRVLSWSGSREFDL